MRDHVAYWMLLYKLNIEENDWAQAAKNLENARELQLKIIVKLTKKNELLHLHEEKNSGGK